jgi:catechol 2,3-dioxygenase-like lactoylglutathione lyase family enzyme
MTSLANANAVVMIHTANRAAALPFYRDILGLELLAQDPFAAVFALNGATLRLSDVKGWTPHPHTVMGFDVPDVGAAARELAAKGVKFLIYEGFGQDAAGVWTAPDGSARVAWFNDPDGNNLSLTQVG